MGFYAKSGNLGEFLIISRVFSGPSMGIECPDFDLINVGKYDVGPGFLGLAKGNHL